LVAIDEFVRPSEVDMEAINMWVRFCDPLKALLKEQFARKLSVSLGSVVSVDTSLPTYLRVRVSFPLAKPLVSEIRMKVKARGGCRWLLDMKMFHTSALGVGTWDMLIESTRMGAMARIV
jgi:hypothetical protein